MGLALTGSGRAGLPHRLAAAGVLLLAAAVGGCATSLVVGPPLPGEIAPATVDSTAVDAGLARVLESGSAGERIRYRLVDGREAWLALGPIYQSSRGVPCRVGRTSAAEAGAANPTSYPFCRIENQWYATSPVVISGY